MTRPFAALTAGLLLAGTERGAFVSLNEGDTWQSLQINLPVTSVRDFEVHGNDLIVATHGRGFWVIDDMAALRQLSSEVLASDAYLFKPSDTASLYQGDDNGTPVQRDEPQAENPPFGVPIDFYIKSAPTSPVTLEIVDAQGSVVRTFSTAAPETAPVRGRGGRAGGIPSVSPLWQPVPERFSASAGMHRVVWIPVTTPPRGGGGGGGGAAGGGGFNRQPMPLVGNFTARLTVNGRAYTQQFLVKPDPRPLKSD